LRESNPAATGAMLLDELLELGVLLGRPWPFLHVVLIAARSPPHEDATKRSARTKQRPTPKLYQIPLLSTFS
jgi:hypothetical protein